MFLQSGVRERVTEFQNPIILPPYGIFNLNYLQSLYSIGINDYTVRKVGNLTRLRYLGIDNVKRNHGKELSASLQKMKALLHLTVSVISEGEILDLEAASSPPPHLKYIGLEGRLERLPSWIGTLQTLAWLDLLRSNMNEDPLSSLEALPNLMHPGVEPGFHYGGPKLE